MVVPLPPVPVDIPSEGMLPVEAESPVELEFGMEPELELPELVEPPELAPAAAPPPADCATITGLLKARVGVMKLKASVAANRLRLTVLT